MKKKNIKEYLFNTNAPVLIVAELSCNHAQRFDIAVKSLEAMKKAGVDAVKLQTYTPDTITIDVKNKYFLIKQKTLWDGQTFYDLYKKAYTPWEWQPKLQKIAQKLGLLFFSSAFDKTAVDFLDKLHVPCHKVASFEITDIPLIEYMASKHKPMIMSTGIATLADIEEAVLACRRKGNNEIVLMKCTSEYPAKLEDVNLRTISNLSETFNCPVGLSDHTLGMDVPLGAVALGARVIEKHFILDKKLGGPDVAFSLDQKEFASMVTSIRNVEQSLGTVSYRLTEELKRSRELSRSLFVVRDIKKNEVFTEKNVRSIRPGFGLAPKYLPSILGKRARQNIMRGEPMRWSFIP